MDTITFIDPAVVGWIKDNVIFTKVYGKKKDGSRTAFTDSAGVRGFPTYILLQPDGTEIDRAVGFMPAGEFLETFQDFSAGRNTLDDYLNRLKQNSASSDSSESPAGLNYQIANKYRWRGDTKSAERYFQSVIQLDPDNKEGFTVESAYALADMARRDYDYELAIRRYQDLIDSYSKSEYLPDFYIYQAICLKDAGKTQEAIDRFTEYIKLFPESEDVKYAQDKIESLREELQEKAKR